MTRVGGRRLELICVLCNDSLADLERACAGELANNSRNDNSMGAAGGGLETATAMSETNSTYFPDIGGYHVSPQPHYGGYMPLMEHNQKQVVATKCGHMFHQGCLRKHVHKTLIEGKGGSLFCPICTRPFAMNRLWPVIIPPTKAQRERYLQLKLMKTQNAEMVKQLKEIRAKIADEEESLKRIKDDSEQCLYDIQQKQKLLESVNGPTNKEMAELTKLHIKRQEILHVVTQHNADLLKLLAEESNISTATAENMINVNSANPNVDVNQNYAPTSAASLRPEASTRKSSRKVKKDKTKKKDKSRKKSRRRHHTYNSPPSSKSRTRRKGGGEIDYENFMDERGDTGADKYISGPVPSELISELDSPRKADKRIKSKPNCRKVDTLCQWNMESMKELMYLPGSSGTNASQQSTISTNSHLGHRDAISQPHRQRQRQNSSNNRDSANIILSRKPNMLENDGFRGGSKK